MTFDLNRAIELAQYSSEAYHPAVTEVFLKSPKTDGAVLVKFVTDTDVVLAFRGTQNLQDWLADAKFVKTPLEHDVNIHSGFLEDIQSLIPLITTCLNQHYKSKNDFKLTITGHSLGGALASLGALLLQREGYIIESVYTFASPRVGNSGWRDTYNKTLGDITFRVAAQGDLVPLVPGVLLPFWDGYRHVGIEVYILDGQYIVNPSHDLEISKDGVRAYLALQTGNFNFVVQFHSIDNDYLKILIGLQKK